MRKPSLYSFQASLPRLPVPSLEDTTRRVNPFKNYYFHFCISSLSLQKSLLTRPSSRLVFEVGEATSDRRAVPEDAKVSQGIPAGNRQEVTTLLVPEVMVVHQLRQSLLSFILN